MKSIKTIMAVALSMTMLSSCGIYNKFDAADQSAMAREYAEALAQQPDSLSFGNVQWEQVFTDPMLVDLIRQALDNNTDLKNAMLNVEIAQANLRGAKMSFFPSVALTPSGAGAKYDHHTSMSWTYQIPLSVSWEIDVFGKLLTNKRAAQASYNMAEDYRQAARSQIIAAVATTYYGIATLESQLKLNRETAQMWSESVRTMMDLKEAGRVNESAVVQSRAQYLGILASITDVEVSLNDMHNTMSLLLGVMPGARWNVSPEAVLAAPAIMRDAIPMRELAARPDVRAAEQSLAVAFYQTANARARFYPGLSISANGGFTNAMGSFITNPAIFFVQLAGSLTVPIFARGQNIANLQASKARQQQALNTFEYTLMSASAEVSNAMTLYEKSVEKQRLLTEQVENLKKSVEITQELLTLGGQGTTYLEVLTAQQSLLSAQIGEIVARNNQSRSVINLYQSLGGGR